MNRKTENFMTIESRIPQRAFVGFSAEATAQALMIDLDASSTEARATDRDATRERFDAAEEALDHAARKATRMMVAGIFEHSSELAQGAIGIASAGSRLSADGPRAEVAATNPNAATAANPSTPTSEAPRVDPSVEPPNTPAENASGAGRSLRIADPMARGILGLGSTMAGLAASRSEEAETRAELRADRAESRAMDASERATRDRSVRDGLARQLDDLMRERHQADERAAQPIGG